MYQSLASIAESVATIILALKLRTLIALPLGIVCGGLAFTFLSFIFSRVHFSRISLTKIKELFAYGKWVTVGTFVSYLNDQGDDFLVSKALGAYPLGLYQTAYKISNLTTTQGAGLIYQIIFPIFSTIQTETVRLKRGILKALAITFTLSAVFSLSVYYFAPWMVTIFLGPAWLEMIPALNVLLLFALTRPLISVGAALFDALGQPRVVAGFNLTKLAVMLILLWPLTKNFGLVGTAWAVVLAQISVYPLFLIKLKKILA